MIIRGLAVVSLAITAVASPLLACPSVPVCVPQACVDMRHPYISPARSGTGLASALPTSLNMTLHAQLPLSQMGGGGGSSLYAWIDPLTSREYAIMGRSNGTAVIDVTIPTQPKYVANVPRINTASTLWREPKVYGDHAYIGVDGTTHRMQIVDLTQVRSYGGTPLTLNYSTFNGTFGGQTVNNIHTVGLNKDSGYLYLSGTSINSGAPLIVDVRNPGNPVPAGMVPGGGAGWNGYSHEAQIVTYNGPDAQHRGKEVMFSSNGKIGAGDTVSVVDVTNKAAPVRLSSKTYTGAQYIHQGWLTEDQRYFFQNDELDEPGLAPQTRTHLWDMVDLDNPVYRGYFQHTTTSTDHNLYVKNGYVFEANYTTGLRVLKIGNLQSSNPADWLQEVAYYDTYLPDDHAGDPWSGAWNVYPYLPSGNVLVSDINGGLFVLRPNLPGWNNGQGLGLPNPFNDIEPFALAPEPGSAMLIAASLLALTRRASRRPRT